MADIERQTKILVHKIGNPCRIMFENDNELLICLKIVEPEVTATLFVKENLNRSSAVDQHKDVHYIKSNFGD